MLVVGLEHHRQGFASCHALIYHKNHTEPDLQPHYLYSPIVHKPNLKTEKRKRAYQLLLIHPLLFENIAATIKEDREDKVAQTKGPGEIGGLVSGLHVDAASAFL